MMLFSQIQLPTDLPINLSFRMDRRALVFSFVVAVASALVFGLVPAVQATRTDLTAVMKASDSVAPGRRRRWGRAILVCGQVAVSVVLLIVAMFMYRGFGQQLANGPGYRTDHLLMMSFDPTLVRYSQEQTQQFFAQVADRARAVPGVASVTMTTMVPMSNDSIGFEAVVPGGIPVSGRTREHDACWRRAIDEHYFDAMGLTLLKGRGFLETDGPTRLALRSSTNSSRNTSGRIRIRSASASMRATTSRGCRSSGSRRPASTFSSPNLPATSSTSRTGRPSHAK